jgi:hypothetical protein
MARLRSDAITRGAFPDPDQRLVFQVRDVADPVASDSACAISTPGPGAHPLASLMPVTRPTDTCAGPVSRLRDIIAIMSDSLLIRNLPESLKPALGGRGAGRGGGG